MSVCSILAAVRGSKPVCGRLTIPDRYASRSGGDDSHSMPDPGAESGRVVTRAKKNCRRSRSSRASRRGDRVKRAPRSRRATRSAGVCGSGGKAELYVEILRRGRCKAMVAK